MFIPYQRAMVDIVGTNSRKEEILLELKTIQEAEKYHKSLLNNDCISIQE